MRAMHKLATRSSQCGAVRVLSPLQPACFRVGIFDEIVPRMHSLFLFLVISLPISLVVACKLRAISLMTISFSALCGYHLYSAQAYW